MLHNVYTELLATYAVMSVPLAVYSAEMFWVVLASARPLNRSPQAFWSGQLHTDQFCIFLCSWHMSEVSTHTQIHTHTHKHTLQYCHVSIYTYQCRLGPRALSES